MAKWWRRRPTPVEALSTHSNLTGVLGASWRASVTQWGDLEFEDGSASLSWFVAADDRWHHPSREAAVRQRLIEGAPVFETRMRVPRGDVVQTIWSATAGGVGVTVIDVANESALPIAAAFSRTDLVTSRPTASSQEWPAPGLDLPSRPLVVPIGHRSSARVVLRHDGRVDPLSADVPDAESVVRGWLGLAERAGRLAVPDVVDGVPLADRVMAARCQAILHGDDGDTAAKRLLDLDERVRANLETTDAVEIAGLVEELLADLRLRRADTTTARLALTAGARLLADDRRAIDDLVSSVATCRGTRADDLVAAWGDVEPVTSLDVSRHVLPALVHDRLARLTGRDTVTLLADGMPADWFGASCEAHGIAVGARHRVSFAVRWHGERPAVLWEVDGPPGLTLRSGVDDSWSTTESRGEALWNVPRRPPTTLSVGSQSLS
ncbi:MAG: hypothetical protein ACO3TP_05035 [Ilumatobacteraceae bacterium]